MSTLGTFKVTGGKLLVTDPCYNLGTWCQGVLKNVHNGQWEASIELASKRVSRLFVHAVGQATLGAWHDEDFDVGVDSGQAGFFSYNKYPKEDAADGAFYSECCDLTLSTKGGIVGGFGAVSQSGWGDGGYLCRTKRNADGKIVAAEIIFIDEDEEDLVTCGNCAERVSETDGDGLCLACQDTSADEPEDE